MLDPDLVRIDLLRCKRKLYLSLSSEKEKQAFIVANKLTELGYLQKLIPQDTANDIFYEYNQRLRKRIVDIFFSLTLGVIVSMLLWCYHSIYPHNFSLQFWGVGFGIGLANSFRYCVYIFEDKNKIEPFRKDYQNLQDRINKLWEDMIKEMKE